MLHHFRALSAFTAHPTAVIFLFGFLFDAIMLPSLDDPIARYIGFAYLCLVALLIMFREWVVSRNTASTFEHKLYSTITFCISYFSGSTLSFVFVYSLRSGDFSVSWPLFLILLLCILANEFVATHNFRLTLDVGILFIATLFYTIFNIPLLLKMQNDLTFFISIAIVIFISIIYIYFLRFMSESADNEASRGYAIAIGIPLFVGMLYLLNVIPAVPLSIKSKGVYHNVIRNSAGDYIAKAETDDRSFLQLRTPIHHFMESDEGIYFFSAIDAPAELSAPVSHVWEYYDDVHKKWILK